MDIMKINKSKVHELLSNVDHLMNELEKDELFRNIRNTKFGKWLNSIQKNFENLCIRSVYAKLYHYYRIFCFVKENRSVIKSDTLKNLISGSYMILDDSHKSDDYFFEIDIASRFPKKSKKSLLENTDVIIDGSVFIECKKLHSINSFEKNLKKANEQIKNIESKNKIAFIALDFTDIFDEQTFLKAFEPVKDFYYKMYQELGGDFTENPHFRNVTSVLLSSTLELQFHRMFNKFYKYNSNYQFAEECLGIFYQLYTFIDIDSDTLILVRGATYFPFKEESKQLFHSLEKGF